MDFFWSGVRKDDRYYLLLGEGVGDKNGDGGSAVRLYTGYWLLPARPVDSPTQATVVLAYAADLHSLPIAYSSQQPRRRTRTGREATLEPSARRDPRKATTSPDSSNTQAVIASCSSFSR